MLEVRKVDNNRKDTQGAFRKPTSIYVTDVIYLEKYSGPKVQVCGSSVVNKYSYKTIYVTSRSDISSPD